MIFGKKNLTMLFLLAANILLILFLILADTQLSTLFFAFEISSYHIMCKVYYYFYCFNVVFLREILFIYLIYSKLNFFQLLSPKRSLGSSVFFAESNSIVNHLHWNVPFISDLSTCYEIANIYVCFYDATEKNLYFGPHR